MYAGLFTHMDADADKYGAKARKQINKDLYGKMGTEDERLVWWNPKDANNKDGGYQAGKNLSFPISKLGWEIMFGCV